MPEAPTRRKFFKQVCKALAATYFGRFIKPSPAFPEDLLE